MEWDALSCSSYRTSRDNPDSRAIWPKALQLKHRTTHVSTLIPSLCCISHRNRCTNISLMFHDSLSYNTLLLTKKFTQTDIQRLYNMMIHQMRTCSFKIRTELHQELISLAYFMHFFVGMRIHKEALLRKKKIRERQAI